ncbi:MAG: hypothetical protein GTO55_07790 [Armatimonadetes bacterium]|nr:hypothetical protein [Armatimonadota bacterium]NIM24165.1 hypothetical protein [Armatimonadota bacterium]NIM68024.1 hypothetical protein [Armatimonadota bacterium]NIM76519.1 hypothetical protein [Armatimonadota bacterium]NIN06258.1 hypothetical protein [Armatimonadota bacterium]
MRKLIAAGLFTLLCLMAIGYLAWGISPPPKPAEGVPECKALDPLETLLHSAEIKRPWHEGGLTIFPVVGIKPTGSLRKVLTLDEAMAKKVLAISELGSGQVNRVIANNRSDNHIFMMAGEALGGAKQDRMVGEDTLLPPHSRTQVPVWCVERGRWTGVKEFHSRGFVAPSSVRQRAAESKSQTEVWESVAGVQHATRAPLGSLATVADSEEVKERTDPLREHFTPLPKKRSDICGVVVAYGSEWLAADVFYDPSLFQRLWPKLLDSYLMEISGRHHHHGKPSVKDAETFLGQLFWAQRTAAPTAGAGQRIELRTGGVFGSALIMGDSVVHLEAFPSANIIPYPGTPPSLQYRRDRHGRR